MSTVILVGAGATLAEALPSKPARSARPPLDTTFFELCRLAKLPHRATVKDYLLKHYGFDPFDGRYRMEEVFNYVYSDAFAENTPTGCLEAYWGLLRLYAQAIARTTNPLVGKSRYGVGALIRHIWATNRYEKLSFITFNQDLLIEKAIETAKSMSSYQDIHWDIRQTYGIAFGEELVLTNNSEPFHSPCAQTIFIHKLHGSLNWLYRVRSGADPKNSIRNPPGDLICLNDKKVLTGLWHRPKTRRVDLIPLVVPPIYEKASRYQQALGPIWAHAQDAITKATKLIIFGYSFPETDYAARTLFRRCFYGNKMLHEIIVIDTDPNIAGKVGALIGAKKLRYYNDIPCYINDA